MKLSRETGAGIGGMVVLQLLSSMLAITLLTRMGPAIERILEDNVYSTRAVEQMLAVAASDDPQSKTSAFVQAMARARQNVTEEAERPLLVLIEDHWRPAFAGDSAARRELMKALRSLADVNHESMARASQQAKQLGRAGAWAAAILGAIAFALAMVVYRRLRSRLEVPIERLRTTTQSVRAGNRHARAPRPSGPQEVQQVAEDLNWILDEWMSSTQERGAGSSDERRRAADLRRLVGWLLDRDDVAMVVMDMDTGRRVASNRAGLEAAADEEAWTGVDVPGTRLRVLRHAPETRGVQV